MLQISQVTILALLAMTPALKGVEVQQAATTTIPVDATLYRKHQVCIADVRGTAGKITQIHLVPSVKSQEVLDDLMICVFWDGCQTPFIACSLQQLLGLLAEDGSPANMPELVFGKGFRIFLECTSGPGGRVQGHISYTSLAPPVSSVRVRFDPDLGTTTPQQVDTECYERPTIHPGRGEAIAISNAGFESGRIQPWRDLSWEKGSLRVYSTGSEGVRAHTGKFMVGTIVPGKPTRGCKGLVRVGGLIPGYRYRLSAWVNTYNFDQEPEPKPVPWNAKVRLGLNTTGTFLTELYPEGADLWNVEFSHPRFYFPHCWGARDYADSQEHWSQISVEARAQGCVASCLLRGLQLYGHPGNRKWCLFDDVTLENIPIPMGQIQGRAMDGEGEPLSNVLVTTNPWNFGARTGDDGGFRIEKIPEAVYTLEAKHGTGRALASGVRVLANRSTTVEFTFGKSPTSRIVGGQPHKDQNQLINSGFESGDTIGWQRAYLCDAMDVSSTTRHIVPPTGKFMFGAEHIFHHAGAREIIYQRIPVTKGSRWTFSGRLFAHSADGSSPWDSLRSDEAKCRLVVDPAGRTNFSIVSNVYNGEWQDVSISFEAEAEMVTVGVAMQQRPRAASGLPGDEGISGLGVSKEFRGNYNAYYCDDLHLIPAKPGAKMAESSPRKDQPTVVAGDAPELPDADTATILLPDGKTTIELIRIPAGTFLMGGDSRSGWTNDDEFPRHRVSLSACWIGKYEVTNAQYKAFCDDQNYPHPPDPAFSRIPWAHRDRIYNYGDYFGQMPDYPVVNITWYDAQAFCRWAGLRLPSEAEWEMAARGHGDSLKTYPWGEQTNPAWTTRTRDNTCLQVMPDWYLYTAPVGTFETHKRVYCIGRSVFGVCEMAGNVREWCADWYGPYSHEEQVNPKGPYTGTERVLRGGSWRDRNYGVVTRCSYRRQHDPNYYIWGTTGFRVAADAP
jgi:iron(II)-dependent oxidoreductase